MSLFLKIHLINCAEGAASSSNLIMSVDMTMGTEAKQNKL